ncbi:hypothetical protein DPMN_025042 [Dreissena polymorpha]|uniref:Uncharacterized protein n=1 Tax=Dreissena polymorpha TaxID=45954 RepID=A0A9D4RBB2_DREPO|nr:hypothetical protein DPMN_025042 [Dreissena polymorpha]
MNIAYKTVLLTVSPIKITAREYGIPDASLRHRLWESQSGGNTLRTTTSQEEEAYFTHHLKLRASCGYGYSRSNSVYMASEYSIRSRYSG